ncbi:ADP-dependent (S)-NAD(P)H-hydrate dehydratase [Providencia stuartii]|uniref:NAD(P)H-hydrate dehydratase n=1 Tax=Providencia stuartii TaxID=588 RepID=UPI00069F2B61|nr:NAD(P)H-hydrate dehydratase [Providencia stuartii]KNZ87917.1 ADP-dependent (S)-NAD(P)H-hydrate dehydratase [Providencia stuartii]
MLTSIEKQWLAEQFPLFVKPRPEQSHKGTFGTLNIIGGSAGMTGSCVLAGVAALKSGCGKVIIGFNQSPLTLQLIEHAPELMLRQANEVINGETPTAWVIGCGLGVSSDAQLLINRALSFVEQQQSVLIDADGLNLLAQMPLSQTLSSQTVLTPHPKEAARLLQTTVTAIQTDRLSAAQHLSQRFGCWAVLKGHHTIISAPNGQTWRNETGNSGLATAGSGDVLSGIIGSLLAQSLPIEEAVRAGVWLHGKAADLLIEKGIGPIGLTAHEIIDEARAIRNRATFY